MREELVLSEMRKKSSFVETAVEATNTKKSNHPVLLVIVALLAIAFFKGMGIEDPESVSLVLGRFCLLL